MAFSEKSRKKQEQKKVGKSCNSRARLKACDGLVFYVPFNNIQVISRRWKDDNERLCAMKRYQSLTEFRL